MGKPYRGARLAGRHLFAMSLATLECVVLNPIHICSLEVVLRTRRSELVEDRGDGVPRGPDGPLCFGAQ